MKKALIGLLICFLASYNVKAQDQTGVFSLSGNLSYGTDIESLGVALRAQYGFTSHLRGAGEYKYYIDRHNLSAWGFNADGHYVFSVSNAVQLYPIAGMSFSRWTLDYGRSGILGMHKNSHNRIGLNAGFGAQVSVSRNMFLQMEAKEALIKDHTQFVTSIGFTYQF